jgi:hypothetical protein
MGKYTKKTHANGKPVTNASGRVSSNYDKEYNAKPEQKKNRAQRNRDRAKAVKSGQASVKKNSPGRSGSDVSHASKGAKGKYRMEGSNANRGRK